MHDFCDEQEGAVSGQRIIALMIHSEGYETSLKILSVSQCFLTLAYGEKSGNTSDGDTQLRWSPPSIAGEPILPTSAMMPAARHGVDEEEAWPPAGTQPMEAPQHIADASGRSRCGEALDRPHLPSASIRA
jgi:hypothetical protein